MVDLLRLVLTAIVARIPPPKRSIYMIVTIQRFSSTVDFTSKRTKLSTTVTFRMQSSDQAKNRKIEKRFVP